ncbi:hypothetical protein [Vibrio cholerae]|uniref:hypothetical protein n=1 Tax=Vibrio cholerae TaxID=666 RepID=UPI00115A762B|nr:hypothetical protein [Vibrio cholerae]TQQ11550.1 hypothetical protein FLL69_17165 [Vibrio cholerae]TQQ37515.1 hypothetical protein FLL84_12255 [Vibrio cholerae]TQQ62687.1 hypothetical protein FLL63_06340 [Vibrio cholerae]
MIFVSNIIRIKRISIIALFIALFFLVYDYCQTSQPNIWGDEPDEPYITISGKKPIDAYVEVWTHFWVTGDECEAYSYDLFGQKSHKGGKISQKITHGFAKNDSKYEFRIPYQTYRNSQGCMVELRDFSIQAHNSFGSAGFAQLRVSQAGKEYYNRAMNLNSLISAKECGPYYSEESSRWTNGFGCYYYIDGKKKSKNQEFNAYSAYYNFSEFKNDTVIHYDILAGENYRSEPLSSAQKTEVISDDN